MACRYTYQGKTYEAHEFDDILRAMSPSVAAKFMPGVKEIASAPFVTKTENWLNLALKRIALMAVEGGYDKVAFVNGEQSADRYDLSKEVNAIEVPMVGADGSRSVRIDQPGNTSMKMMIDKDGGVTGYGPSASQFTGKNLDDVVGKEIAAKIMSATEPTTLSGLDLKVGGKGMIKFYDEIVPQALSKLLPKIGGEKLGTVAMGTAAKYRAIQADADGGGEVVTADGETISFHDTADEARAEARRLNGGVLGSTALEQPGFDVTDKMRETVSQGLPLFSRDRSNAEQLLDLDTGDNVDSKGNFYEQLRSKIGQVGSGRIFGSSLPKQLSARRGQDADGRRGEVIESGAAEGASVIRWQPDSLGISDYVTAANWVKTGGVTGLRFVVVAGDLADSIKTSSQAIRASINGDALMTATIYPGEDGDYVVAVGGPNPGSDTYEQFADRITPTGQLNEGGDEYHRMDFGTAGARALLQEAIRRFAIMTGGHVPHITFGRDTGSKAGMRDRRIPASKVESRFSRDRRATILGDLGSLNNDPDYAAGKAGDLNAALRTAARIISPDALDLVSAIDRPVVVGVVSIEASGRNKVPFAAASVIAEATSAELDDEIVQASSPKRTAMDGLGRIFSRPIFDGNVQPGRNYVLVDDTITQGGTFAALADHIESGGGKVAAMIAMSGKQYGAIISADPATITSVREKFGDLENDFQKATGYGFDQLTQSEARYIANFKPASAVRDRISAEGAKSRRTEGQEDSGLLSRDRTDTPEFKKWFGDSKVVDAEGKPLVVYHGTAADFDVFQDPKKMSDLGFHFGTVAQANSFASGKKNSNVMPVYLSIKNPLQMRDVFGPWYGARASMASELVRLGVIGEAESERITNARTQGAGIKLIKDAIERAGYDGVRYFNTHEGDRLTELPDDVEVVRNYDGPSRIENADGSATNRGFRFSVVHDRHGVMGGGDTKQEALADAREAVEAGNFANGEEAWIAFRPEQIKSAIGNNGQFDGSNPDIRKSADRKFNGKDVSIAEKGSWSVYKDRSAQLGDGSVRWIEDSSTAYVTDIQAGQKSRGKAMLEWLRADTGKELYAVGVVDDAQEFWDKMEDEGLITGQTDENFVDYFGMRKSTARKPWFEDLSKLKVSTNYQLGDLLKSSKKLNWWNRTVGTQYNLAQRNPEFKRVFDAVQTFINDVSAYATQAADLAPSILPKLDGIRDVLKKPLSLEDVKALRDPVFGGTLSYMRDDKGELVETDDVQKAGVVFTDAELRDKFKMNDRQIGLYREFRDATDRSLTDLALSDMIRYLGPDGAEIRDQVMASSNVDVGAGVIESHLSDLASREPGRRAALEATIEAIQQKAEQANNLMDRGYAPLSRFGQYTVYAVGKGGEQLYFGMFETQRDANKMAREMAEQYPDAEVTTGIMSQESYKLFSGVTPETLALFGESLGLEENGIDPKSEAFQTYLKLAKTNRSAMKRLIQRKGIDGFSEDAGRVLAGFVYSNARQVSTNLNAGEIGKAASDIKDGDVKDHAIRLMQYIQNPTEEAQKLKALLFTVYLGGNISSALVNISQTATTTFPYLSQFDGAASVIKRLGEAATLAVRGIRNDEELKQALKRAEDEGVVSPQEVFALMAQAQGKAQLQSGDGTKAGDALAKTNNFMTKAGLAWGRLFSAAEQANRRIAFIAAYKLARDKGMESPFAFAEKTVLETQFSTNKGIRPAWARGAVGGVLFTFKGFTVAYLELLARMLGNGPEGKKAFALALGTLFLFAGAGGLPFVDDLDDLVDGFAQRVLGKSFDSKQAKREFFASILGQTGADFVMGGISSLPGAPIDVSGRLGLGNIVPGSGILPKKTSYQRDIMEVLGPAGSLFSNYATAVGMLAQGEVGKAAATAAPVGLQNAIKGMDMATMGFYRDTKGRKVIDTNGWEALAKSMGFQPASVKRIQEATSTQQSLIAQNKMRETEIADKMARARIERKPDLAQEAKEELADWNRKNPQSPISIDQAQVNRRVQQAMMSKAKRLEATAPKEIRGSVRQELERASD